MFKRAFLLTALILLGLACWASPQFQGIAAGVAIFLFGMLSLEEGFSAFSGGRLEKLLKRSTDRTWKSLTFGLLSTSLMQSSSLVSVITISFLSAGLIGLGEGLGIIYGANLGTTTGAWLMAGFGMKVNLSAYAMPMLIFGVIFILQKARPARGLGHILAGLGFLFLGIHFMKEGFEAFKDTIDLSAFAMEGLAGVLVFTGVGVVATVIMQSSHATLMLIIAALASGQVTYDNALGLAIGANIGTTITAILGALGANVAGRRLAAAHLIFNASTALVAIALLGWFRQSVEHIAGWLGLAPDDWVLRLAIFHTLFNLAGVALMTPLIAPTVRLLERTLAPDPGVRPRYLNEAAIHLPETALEVLYKETGRLFDETFAILAHGLDLHRQDLLSERPVEALVEATARPIDIDVMEAYYATIKLLYSEIVEFAAHAQARMDARQLQDVYGIRIACRNLALSVKHLAALVGNVRRYTHSDNPHIRARYTHLRRDLAMVLRQLHRLRTIEEDDLLFLAFQQLEQLQVEQEILSSGLLDKLVREHLITRAMATSLINDTTTAQELTDLLVEAAQRLFVPRTSLLKEVEEEMLLDERPLASYRQMEEAASRSGAALMARAADPEGADHNPERPGGGDGTQEEDQEAAGRP